MSYHLKFSYRSYVYCTLYTRFENFIIDWDVLVHEENLLPLDYMKSGLLQEEQRPEIGDEKAVSYGEITGLLCKETSSCPASRLGPVMI